MSGYWIGAAALALVLLYPYAVYPAALALLAMLYGRNSAGEGPAKPFLTVIASVYNEEAVIGRKIANFLASSYPAELAEMIVVSDGSTDRTAEIAERLNDPRVRVIRQGREGKTRALNRAAKAARGEVLVFTDANTMFREETLEKIASPFADARVGLVSGRVVSEGSEGESLYQRFEQKLKELEGRLGFIAGADGALYALRASCYEELPPELINDLYHPVQLAGRGLRSVYRDDAVATEPAERNVAREYARQKRMAGQAFTVYLAALPRLLAGGNALALWILTSHKAARWLHVPAMAFGLLLASAMALEGHLLLPLAAAAFATSLLLGFLEVRGFRLLFDFEAVHLGYLAGIASRLGGNTGVVWNPRGGSGP